MALAFITPCVMYSTEAEQAANLYASVFSEIFGDASIVHVTRWSAEQLKELERLPAEQRPFKVGDVSYARVRLHGQEVMLANGGPWFKFNDAVSLYVSCDTQAQLDALWARLTADGGQEVECGWLIDRFGLRWQLTTQGVNRLLESEDPQASARAQAAVLRMKKIEEAEVEKAGRGN